LDRHLKREIFSISAISCHSARDAKAAIAAHGIYDRFREKLAIGLMTGLGA
jgi:hypothetical protein